MKQIIRLTENDLHRIVKKSVERILRESSDDAQDAFRKSAKSARQAAAAAQGAAKAAASSTWIPASAAKDRQQNGSSKQTKSKPASRKDIEAATKSSRDAAVKSARQAAAAAPYAAMAASSPSSSSKGKKKSLKESEMFGQGHYSAYRVNDFNEPIEGLGCTIRDLGRYASSRNSVQPAFTANEGLFNDYVEGGTLGVFLRDGWQNEQPEMGEDYPMDSYGLSMIFAIFNENGQLKYCTLRWNHGPRQFDRRVDQALSESELASIVGSSAISQVVGGGLQESRLFRGTRRIGRRY